MERMDTSHFITKELLERVLCQTEKKQNVSVESFEVEIGSKQGENFLCIVYAVTVKAVINGENKTYNFIAKCSPDNELRQQWLNDCNFFGKEVKVYTELIPTMIKFQQDLDKEPLIPTTAKCYYTHTDGKNDVIFMENLKTQGYRMTERTKGLDIEHCKLVMTELAKFHAISFAMKQRYTEPLPQKFPYLKESLVCEGFINVLNMWDDAYKLLMHLAQNNTDYCQYARRMEKFTDGYYNMLREFLEPKEPFAGICHGDCWFNNMLFSYDSDGKSEKPNSVKFLDFQITRYATFTVDLSYFFYTSTTPTLRKNHLDDLLKLYHTSFLEYIKHLDTEAPTYTFEKLKSNFQDSIPFGYLLACVLLPIMLSDPKYVPNISNISKEEEEAFFEEWNQKMTAEMNRNLPLKERVLGMIEEMADKGII